MSQAICVRCGGIRSDYRQVCPRCGHRPEGDGLLLSWLLSSENLGEAELESVAARVRSGEIIRPTSRMLGKARRALGKHVSTDRGLTVRERLLLFGTNLLFTPLVGWVLLLWWWSPRPRAALQALGLTLPVSALFAAIVIWPYLA